MHRRLHRSLFQLRCPHRDFLSLRPTQRRAPHQLLFLRLPCSRNVSFGSDAASLTNDMRTATCGQKMSIGTALQHMRQYQANQPGYKASRCTDHRLRRGNLWHRKINNRMRRKDRVVGNDQEQSAHDNQSPPNNRQDSYYWIKDLMLHESDAKVFVIMIAWAIVLDKPVSKRWNDRQRPKAVFHIGSTIGMTVTVYFDLSYILIH